jgi:hypothetical protein
MKVFGIAFCAAVGIFFSTVDAHANVFASDIKLNGSLSSVSASPSSPVTITYRLNQNATAVTVSILQGGTAVATLVGGTNVGLNTVTWGVTNSSGGALSAGTYSVSIRASASGFAAWQQISVDTNPGMPAYFPLGIAVDNNTNSPYFGRVIMGCTLAGDAPSNNVPIAAEKVGLYKMNADGSQADEGWYGNAGYTNDDAADAPVAGQMPGTSPFNVDPMKIRIGDDDRIYWIDNSYYGAVIACDMEATTNQVVINNNSAHNYENNPNYSSLGIGFQQFDVTETTTANAALWLCQSGQPSIGIWLFHLTNGASDTSDTSGVQVVEAGGDAALDTSGGVSVDNHLDIFVGQNSVSESAIYGAMEFTNWDGGVLPPPNTNGATTSTYVVGGAAGEVAWGFGCGVDTTCTNDPTFEAVNDVVINSKLNPTLLACPMSAGSDNGNGGGIRVLNATNGSVITVTNGAVVQSLTNIDWGQSYTCAAWDGVGNLYAASSTRNLWRVWSPPGGNTNTTFSAASVSLSTGPPPSFKITSVIRSGTTLTITFTAPASDSASSFTLQSSGTLSGTYGAVSGATVTGSGGTFTVSATMSGTMQFYRIAQ